MKNSHSFVVLFALALAGALSGTSAQAQQSAGDTLYFNNGAGGNGTWQNGADGTTWADPNASANVDWDNTVQTFGVFNNTPGSVTVSGTVNVNSLEFDSNYTLTGGTIEKNGDVFSGPFTDSNVVNVNNNSNVTIDNDIVVDTTQPTDQYDINNNGSGTVTYNGNITYVGTGHPSSSVLIDNAAAGSTTILNGSFSNANSDRTSSIWIRGSDAATLILNGDYTNLTTNGTFLAVQNGTAILGTSKTGTGIISIGSVLNDVKLLTSGAQTIANQIVVLNLNQSTGEPGNAIIGENTADVVTYSGNVTAIVSGTTFTALAGGQVNFTGSIGGNIPTGLIKTGAGTVNLSGANTYGLQYFTGPILHGTVAADIQQGTLLITNTTGSAFGNNAGQVQIESGATLGGGGISSETVVAMAANTVIAPGLQGSTPTTMHLNGGITEENGLTMDFKLSGDSNDSIDFGGANIHVDGLLTINLSGTPTVNDANAGRFFLFTDFGTNNSGDPADFVVNAPAGFKVLDSGVLLNTNTGGTDYYVDLAASPVPEPSTYALFALGTAGLVFFARFRRVAA